MILTGFHSIEEKIRSVEEKINSAHMFLEYSKPGPRVKKILELAKKAGIPCTETSIEHLDSLVSSLPETAQDHRGLVLSIQSTETSKNNTVDFDQFIQRLSPTKKTTVVILDSITDPHNVGAIIRSADQFGIDLIVLPEKRGAKDSEVISRSSAGAVAWVQVSVVPNLVRAVQQLQKAGFWIYGADAGGETTSQTHFAQKTALIMGSEGSGISRLLSQQCDTIVSIPTCGKLDSLNVSVAAGILLYEISLDRTPGRN